jgi:hypothetical protein
MASALLPAEVMADSITGIIDWTYTDFSSRTKEATGQTTKIESKSYLQSYTLFLDKTIFPKLKLDAGGVFERDLIKSKSSDTEFDSTNTQFRPYATLSLKDPLYAVGVGYFLREERQEFSRAPSVTLVSEDYNTFFNWRPDGFPRMDMIATRTNTYDRNRANIDTTKDSVLLTSLYSFKGLDLKYSGAYLDTNDGLHRIDTQDTSHTGAGTYADSLLNGRLTLSSAYRITHDATTVTSSGTGAGTVSTQIFPSQGLSALSDTPNLVALDPNPALIDGNVTASAGPNIGEGPRLAGDNRGRNIGLDLRTPTEVNDLFLWVDREIPQGIAATFSFDIYTSSDNLNWTLLQAGRRATFEPFQNRFDINFANTSTRYVKIVVRPLEPTVPGANNFADIFVAELQAFIQRPVAQAGEQKFTSTSQISNTSVQYRIFDAPLLFYDVSYYFTKGDTSAQEQSTLSNGLSVNHQLTTILTALARVAREDGTEQNEKRTAYVYNASVRATPIRTVTNSLVFGGRNEHVGSGSRRITSLFSNNTAQVYQGIDLSLQGGIVSSTELDGSKTTLATVAVGANIIPHRTMTWTFNYSYSDAARTLSGAGKESSVTRQTNVMVAYNPFRTFYATASLQFFDETGQGLRTLQNYGLNWSPFPDGALQFRFAYNETRQPQEQTSDRFISPGVRYKINERSFLDLSYQSIKSDSAGQTIDSRVLSANLKIFL